MTEAPKHQLSQLALQLQESGLKVTQQRLVILQAIKERADHPWVEQIYEDIVAANPTISLATVYKTLETLAEHGLIKRVASTDGQKRYDPKVENHGHINCLNTREIIDYYDQELHALIYEFFKKKKVGNLKIKNISVEINADKIDQDRAVYIK